MLLSAMSVLVVAQLSSEIPEGLMNNPVHYEVSCFHFVFFLIVHGFLVPMYVGCTFFICTLSLLSGSDILIMQHAGQQMELLHL